jgi:hypothetical protein
MVDYARRSARNEISRGGEALSKVLLDFQKWYPHEADLWGNGAVFDNVILSNAYAACAIDKPWKFWNDKCYRTLKGLYPQIELERTGTHHNALDDAVSQANHAVKILQHIG